MASYNRLKQQPNNSILLACENLIRFTNYSSTEMKNNLLFNEHISTAAENCLCYRVRLLHVFQQSWKMTLPLLSKMYVC